MADLTLIIFVIALALVFDFLNGFHDAANSIATIVGTGVLKPHTAVILATFWNFFGAFVFSVAVATTIGKGVINPEIVNTFVILAALVGAIFWNILTWYYGIPSSSSHAIIGGLLGAGIASAGFGSIITSGITKIVIFIFVAPSLGFVGAVLVSVVVYQICKKKSPEKTNKYFKGLQLVSSSFYSLGHGTNDAQKTMGVITLLLFSGGLISTFYVPTWVIISSYSAIALGTYFGGWRIVKTMGLQLTKLRPFQGFSAETAGAGTLFFASHFGIPVSTTHVIAGSIMGVGAAKRVSAVRWKLARKIIYAWIITIPASALVAGLTYLIISSFV
ncbi:inorganic phosphate transporter [Candidatus Pacearchaeota archaeon]|nr:inorganic phosphate transporter [Candidatus Pacearchaeota archaeon]